MNPRLKPMRNCNPKACSIPMNFYSKQLSPISSWNLIKADLPYFFGVDCSFLQFAHLKLQFLCYSQINSSFWTILGLPLYLGDIPWHQKWDPKERSPKGWRPSERGALCAPHFCESPSLLVLWVCPWILSSFPWLELPDFIQDPSKCFTLFV